ncbi:MAG: DUF3810 domain-containing protein [Oscillospiraceae bacterium]|nr:DUF3810 domain-containing protein [Oscillospiraceae bacterium]
MKYWRGYLTAAIFALVSWGLLKLAEKFTTLVDMVFPYVTRTIQSFLAAWSGGVDILVWQIAVVLMVVFLLATLVLMIIFRWNLIQWLGWVLAGASFLYFLHTGLYGLNYHAGPLADDVRLNVTEYTLDELTNATIYYRNLANDFAVQMPRDAAGDVVFEDFDTLAAKAGEGFDVLTYEHSFSVFAGDLRPVKKLGWANLFTSMGITGVTMPITGEAAVNPLIPDVALPFTMCHEMAHRMCIAIERDANFAGFLACQANSNLQFQYSAYFMAYRYCYDALASVNTVEAANAAARVSAGANEFLRHDLTGYADFFNEKRNDQATRLADTANDTYIKVNGDDSGVESYGQVADLLVSWHIQEVVLPAQKTEAEESFDPYDENQVDLSGIAGALD